MDLFEKIERTRHFGELFLVWLWYHSDIDESVFRLSDGSLMTLIFDNAMTLEVKLAEAERATLSGGSPASSKEAHEALRQGKLVRSVKLRVERDEKEWVFVLTAQTLALSSLKIPALMTKEEDEKLYERQYLIEEIDSLIRGLYERFLNIRLDEKSWQKESKSMSAWIYADLD